MTELNVRKFLKFRVPNCGEKMLPGVLFGQNFSSPVIFSGSFPKVGDLQKKVEHHHNKCTPTCTK